MSFKKIMAFTLAEVLITLGIIGVVAALTVPTLVQRYKEKATVTKVNKVYSILSNALLSAINEYGTIDGWDITNSTSGAKDENGKTILDSTSMEVIGTRLGKFMKGTRLDENWGNDIIETNMQQVPIENRNNRFDRPVAFTLDDGTVIMIGSTYSGEACAKSTLNPLKICSCTVVWFPDITKKRIEGINQFSFLIMKDRIIPFGDPGEMANRSFDSTCKMSINKRESGRGCTSWIIKNKNMDYLHCDDLSWDGKKKCN